MQEWLKDVESSWSSSRRKKNEPKAILEEIVTENFPELMKDMSYSRFPTNAKEHKQKGFSYLDVFRLTQTNFNKWNITKDKWKKFYIYSEGGKKKDKLPLKTDWQIDS